MSFQSLADVFAYVQTHDDLTTNEVAVLLAIAHHADRTGADAYPDLREGTCDETSFGGGVGCPLCRP